MRVPEIIIQRDAGHIFLMQPLLYHDNGTFLGVIQTIWHNFGKPHICGPTHRFTFHHHGVVRIIDYKAVSAFTDADAADRRRELPSGLIIGELDFGELLIGDTKPAPPKPLVALTHDDIAAAQIIALCQMVRIGSTDIAIPWSILRTPFPRRPEDVCKK